MMASKEHIAQGECEVLRITDLVRRLADQAELVGHQ